MTIAPDVPEIDLGANVAVSTDEMRRGDVVPPSDVLDPIEMATLADETPAAITDYDALADEAEREYREQVEKAQKLLDDVEERIETLSTVYGLTEHQKFLRALGDLHITHEEHTAAELLVREDDARKEAAPATVEELSREAYAAAERNGLIA